jgi:hypothetical protein
MCAIMRPAPARLIAAVNWMTCPFADVATDPELRTGCRVPHSRVKSPLLIARRGISIVDGFAARQDKKGKRCERHLHFHFW